MKKYHFSGELSISDTPSINNKMNYIINDTGTLEQTSITDILDNIFNGRNINNKLVRVLGRANNVEFNGMGNLHMCRDKSHKVEGYCIGSMQLENWLFKNVDNFCELVIEDYTSFEIAEELMSNDKAKSIS